MLAKYQAALTSHREQLDADQGRVDRAFAATRAIAARGRSVNSVSELDAIIREHYPIAAYPELS